MASEEVKPGYLVKGVSTIAVQTVDGTKVPVTLAVERSAMGAGFDNSLQGSGTPSAFYASGDTVLVALCPPGAEVTVWIASGQNIQEDELLGSTGDGTFDTGATVPLIRALETVGAVTVLTPLRAQVI